MLKKILFSIGLIANFVGNVEAALASRPGKQKDLHHHVDPSGLCKKTDNALTIFYSQSTYSYLHGRHITIFARKNKDTGKISCYYELNDDPQSPTPVEFGPGTRQDLPETTFHDFEKIYSPDLTSE
jgi:hypothetical protein